MPASPTQLVLITGANQGIGFQIAKILASPSEHPDHYVLLGCRDLAKGQEAANQIGGDRVEAIQIDVTDLTSIEEARRLVDTKWGRLDVLINNAAVLRDSSVSSTYSLGEAMRDSFNTNTIGVANTVEAFLPLLQESDHPRIVMMSSRAGSLAARADWVPTYTSTKYRAPAYDCSKAALNMLMLQYKNILPPKFKINSCCPGFRKTNFCSFDENAGPVEEGAINAVRLATLGEDDESGTFSNKDGPVPW